MLELNWMVIDCIINFLELCRMMVESALNHPFLESRCRTLLFGCENKSSGRAKHSHGTVEKGKCDRFFLDRRGALRSFDAKRLSRKKGTTYIIIPFHIRSL